MSREPVYGSAWIFGDNVDTDAIYPGRYLHIIDKEDMAAHAFEFVKPEFVKKVEPEDIVIAGKNFGCGSSREHAVHCIKQNGISAVIALSFARIFYRNAINTGLTAVTLDIDENKLVDLYSNVFDGDDVQLDLEKGILTLESTGAEFPVLPLPEHLRAIIDDNGLIEHMKKKLSENQEKPL